MSVLLWRLLYISFTIIFRDLHYEVLTPAAFCSLPWIVLPLNLLESRLKTGFHIVVTSRWVSLTVFHGHWSIWVFGNHCQSLAVFPDRWQSFMVVPKSSFKLLLLAPNLLTASRWWSFRVVGDRQRYFVSIWQKWNDRLVGGLSWSFTVAEIDL